jgi:hypothetical protein
VAKKAPSPRPTIRPPAPTSARELATWLAAIANTGGGRLLLNPTNTRRPWGPPPLKLLLPHALRLTSPRPELQPQTVQGLTQLSISARPPAIGPVLVKDGPRTRGYELHEEAPREWTRHQLQDRLRIAGLVNDELDPARGRDLRALDSGLLERLCDHFEVNCGNRRALETLGVLSDSWGKQPTIAAAVALGQETHLLIARHAGKLFVPARLPLSEVTHHDSLTATVQRILRASEPAVGGVAAPIVREIVLNAIAHRSYAPADRKRPIVADIYADAVRITSPGAALPRALVNGLPRSPYSRNPVLVTFLRALGLARGHGRGLTQLLADAPGTRPVQLSFQPDAFVVTTRAGRDAAPVPAPQYTRRTTAELEEMLLSQLQSHGPLTRSQLEVLLGVSRSRVGQLLAPLLATHQVETVHGKARSPRQAYRISAAS